MNRLLPDPSQPMDSDQASDAFERIFEGEIDEAALTNFLTILADRGETIDEVTAAAHALRARISNPIHAPDSIDVCGTGGDGQHSLNISTAVALVVAACGIPVAKHGNRAASSQSGAADVLSALGVPELQVDRLEACLKTTGITFLHAARHHPAMARVAPVRRALGRRTIFNLLGPLASPAGVRRQLVGVYAPHILPLMAGALKNLGSEAAMVVHGDGFDELAISAASQAIVLTNGELAIRTITPQDAGLSQQPSTALKGGEPAHNAAALLRLLSGEQGAYHDITVLNAAAALTVADPAITLAAASLQARQAISSGAAADTLARWKAFR